MLVLLVLVLSLLPLEVSLWVVLFELLSLSPELLSSLLVEPPSLSPRLKSLSPSALLTLSPALLSLVLVEPQPPQCPACAADAPNSNAANAADPIPSLPIFEATQSYQGSSVDRNRH